MVKRHAVLFNMTSYRAFFDLYGEENYWLDIYNHYHPSPMCYAFREEGGEKVRGKKLVPEGMMVMCLETDLKKSRAFDESKLTPLQANVFSQLSSIDKDKIREGYGMLIVDLKDEQIRCEFNMENYHPPARAYESIARFLLPKIQEYYSKEENRRAFDEHMAKEKGNKYHLERVEQEVQPFRSHDNMKKVVNNSCCKIRQNVL